MVGLPARGKSYLSKQLAKYLNEHNLNTEIFNVGNTRRAEDGSRDASFFSASNQENVKLREKFAIDTLNELLHWLYNDLATDNVAILDATNSTVIRRIALMNTIDTYDSKNEVNNTDILFLENIVDDEHIIHNNIISKLMLSPDYNDSKGKDSIAYDSTAVQGGGVSDYLALNPEQIGAFKDFQERLVNYERAYETIDTDELVLLKEGNNDNIKMIKLYNYGGTFMKAGDISLFNVMTGSQLIHSKKLDSKRII